MYWQKTDQLQKEIQDLENKIKEYQEKKNQLKQQVVATIRERYPILYQVEVNTDWVNALVGYCTSEEKAKLAVSVGTTKSYRPRPSSTVADMFLLELDCLTK